MKPVRWFEYSLIKRELVRVTPWLIQTPASVALKVLLNFGGLKEMHFLNQKMLWRDSFRTANSQLDQQVPSANSTQNES